MKRLREIGWCIFLSHPHIHSPYNYETLFATFYCLQLSFEEEIGGCILLFSLDHWTWQNLQILFWHSSLSDLTWNEIRRFHSRDMGEIRWMHFLIHKTPHINSPFNDETSSQYFIVYNWFSNLNRSIYFNVLIRSLTMIEFTKLFLTFTILIYLTWN